MLVVFGLYACSESTVTEPKVDAKKYTLEEILADPNWVEITDTLYIDDKPYKGYSYLYEKWDMFTIVKFFNIVYNI